MTDQDCTLFYLPQWPYMVFMTNFKDQLLHIQRKFKRTVELYAVFRFTVKKKLVNRNIVRCECLKKATPLERGKQKHRKGDSEMNATEPGLMVHSFNPSAQEAKAGRSP